LKAIWNTKINEESTNTKNSVCPWKGVASYYNLEDNGSKNKDAAWYYPEISELVILIKGSVAFWKGVENTE
jgi:uncharacterized protein (DUF427 family)